MMSRILFIKPSSLGDVVHAIPALRALRAAHPSAHITWLVKRQWAPLVERVDGVDRVWPVEGGFLRWLTAVPALRAERFDIAVDLQGLLRSGLIAWLSGAPRRVGFAAGREGSPRFYTDRITVPARDTHAVDRYLLVARALGAAAAPPAFGLRELASDAGEVERRLAESGLAAGTRWVAVNASARWLTKRWPVERFAVVADRIQSEGLGRIAVIGGPEDREVAHALARAMRTPLVDLAGAFDLGLLPALLRSAAVLLTNDSGPMHVAAAVGTPVVALFGPTSPARTGPYGAGHAVLVAGIPCSPCYSRQCTNEEPLACLTALTPDAVLEAVRGRLAAARPPASAWMTHAQPV
jgi:lipopolysaccharide heptosyltransferase II